MKYILVKTYEKNGVVQSDGVTHDQRYVTGDTLIARRPLRELHNADHADDGTWTGVAGGLARRRMSARYRPSYFMPP